MKALRLFPLVCLIGQAAVVWQDPAVMGRDDKGAPAAPFQFQREETGGTSPKVVVKDANGVTWYVKFGFEAKPETFASKIVRSAGYFAPVTYFVPEGAITGFPAQKLKRAQKAVDAGSGRFRDARFSRQMEFVKGEKWTLDEPALKGTRELSGLKLLIMLTANWDIKPPNFAVIQSAGQPMFAITDWGQTFGAPDKKNQWSCKDYREQTPNWTQGVEDGYVYLQFDGKVRDVITNGVRVADARWLLGLLQGMTEARTRELLRSSGATAEEASCLAPAFVERVQALRATVTGPR